METLSAVTATISNTLFGTSSQSKEEPQNGVQGDTSKGEPFDGGNMEPQKQEIDNPVEKKDTSAIPESGNPTETKDTPTIPESNPAETKDSSTLHGDSTKAQNDVRDPSDPKTDANANSGVDNTGDGPNEAPNVDGPGPKPVAQVAKEHGGDAGLSGKEETRTDGAGDGKEASNGADDEDDDGPEKVSHGEGTGEQYVKSTGLQADGGDFDATKPGAGREADRLLEQKGIHHTVDKTSEDASPEPSPERKEKKSFGSKIKAKLHRNSGS